MTTTIKTIPGLPDLSAGGVVMPVIDTVKVRAGYRRIVNQTRRQEGPI